LSVIKQGYRFLFEPAAKVFIKVPSRSPRHELERRRRIVCRSLKGIALHRDLLNPFAHGMFSLNLLINKINRRFLPVYLLLIFFSSMGLSFSTPLMRIFLFLQVAFYLLAASSPVLSRHARGLRGVKKLASLTYYFCIGNYGTLLGLIDFLRGKQITKWQPLKTDR
jgi:hypothetical protein